MIFAMFADEAGYMMICEEAMMNDPALTQQQIDCVVDAASRGANGCGEQLGCLIML